jgi:hypothetical protein
MPLSVWTQTASLTVIWCGVRSAKASGFRGGRQGERAHQNGSEGFSSWRPACFGTFERQFVKLHPFTDEWGDADCSVTTKHDVDALKTHPM